MKQASHPTGVRGLKWIRGDAGDAHLEVAPHWGAWIEIRGLDESEGEAQSHPTGVRGLKCVGRIVTACAYIVAPHWGAWIEI